jgi:type IV secretory pathway VirD2 relaxase
LFSAPPSSCRRASKAQEDIAMTEDDIKPKPGRIRDTARSELPRLKQQVFQRAGRAGLRARWSKGHIRPGALRRGMGTGVRAASGLIAPGSRRVIVKARYTRIRRGNLGAARAHFKYILRDGVTRDGAPGHLYDVTHDHLEPGNFLDRSAGDPHQFRFIVSAEDSPRLRDLKPFVRRLMAQMERDLDTRLDWAAVDHFNTGHPHTHIVIRGKDDQGHDLVMARDYIGHGVRARAQGLITLELGRESELERIQKLYNEVGQERLTRLDRAILVRAQDGILTVTAERDQDSVQRVLRIGRLKTLERMGLAAERQPGVWQLDVNLEPKLRRLGERADKLKMMQRALHDAGIDRAAAEMALFEKRPRKEPLIGQVVGAGMVDEITDRTWIVLDAVDGRVHYAELGRLKPDDMPVRGMLAALGGDSLQEKPSAVPRLHVLSAVDVQRVTAYDGPTWLDEAIIANWRPEAGIRGYAAELGASLSSRGAWLAERQLAALTRDGGIVPVPGMMTELRKRETEQLVKDLSRHLKAEFMPVMSGARITGIYDRAIATPTGKIAVIRRADTFMLAPWKPALEPMRGLAVTAIVGPNRVTWTRDRGRGLPGRE